MTVCFGAACLLQSPPSAAHLLSCRPSCLTALPPPSLRQVNLFLAVLKHRFATASSLYSKAVTSHGKPRSTLALAWQALRARFRRHMATQRGLFEERMSQRSSRSASARSPGSKEQVCKGLHQSLLFMHR